MSVYGSSSIENEYVYSFDIQTELLLLLQILIFVCCLFQDFSKMPPVTIGKTADACLNHLLFYQSSDNYKLAKTILPSLLMVNTLLSVLILWLVLQ